MCLVMLVTMIMTMRVVMGVTVLLVPMTMPGSIIGVLTMRFRRVKSMGKLGSHIRFLGRIIRVTPALALQMESRGRQHFLQLRLAAFRAVHQWPFSELLESIKSMTTFVTTISKNRHS